MVGPPRRGFVPMKKPILPKAHAATMRSLSAIEKVLHIEAVGGIVLFIVAIIALIWANSSLANSYHALWHTPVGISFGSFAFSQSLHFWINDALMTIFFLVVGMEIRKEIHDGALSNFRLATLPIAAAIGGVVTPAIIYLALNHAPIQQQGWAVPTATDIAFAVGALAILGKSIPANIRVFLLALAIIDDIVAVLIIAFFYSGGLDINGLFIAAFGIFLVLLFQWLGLRSAYAYIVPGAILWIGLLMTGAHPTLAGVVLGLMTPVVASISKEKYVETVTDAINTLKTTDQDGKLTVSYNELHKVQRELLPPVTRVNMALHPWVTYGVMPLFALANAGITIDSLDLSATSAQHVMFGVIAALVLGKPIGILLSSFIVVKLGICHLPKGVTWNGILLAGLLAGIGFTMSIFIATLAFTDETLLGAAKAGVLLASLISIIIGLSWGYFLKKRLENNRLSN